MRHDERIAILAVAVKVSCDVMCCIIHRVIDWTKGLVAVLRPGLIAINTFGSAFQGE